MPAERGQIFHNDGSRPLEVPGFPNHPPGFQFQAHLRFVHGDDFGHFKESPPTLRELAMLQLMEDLTDEDGWTEKIFDRSARKVWKTAALTRPLINKAAWRWCVAELKDKAAADTKHFMTLNLYAGVCKSDTAISAGLCEDLARHLGSQGEREHRKRTRQKASEESFVCESRQIDPALYPLVFDHTRVLTEGGQVDLKHVTQQVGQGNIISMEGHRNSFRASRTDAYSPSSHSQWLPFEVRFGKSKRGVRPRITSYINNVHPQDDRIIYKVIKKMLPVAIDMWNQVLIKEDMPRYPRRIKAWGVAWSEKPWKDLSWIEDPDELEDVDVLASATEYVGEYLAGPPPLYCTCPESVLPHPPLHERAAEFPELLHKQWLQVRTWQHPDPGVSFSYKQWKRGDTTCGLECDHSKYTLPYDWDVGHQYYTVAIEEQFRGLGIQVIAEASSVDLLSVDPSSGVSSSKPYPGDEWKIQGLLNEHIVATARIYYSVHNVTDLRIHFRHEITSNYSRFPDNRQRQFFETFHIEGGGESRFPFAGECDEDCVEIELGSITLRTGRMLAWPNNVETRLGEFALQDPTMPGHVRWLTLHLVDPHYRIVSTRNVPPQQASWWSRDALAAADLQRWLPPELVNMIVEMVGEDWPMSSEAGRQYKEAMDKERTRTSRF